MGDNIVSIEALRKEYSVKTGDTLVALRNIDLEIPNGSFFGLLGPNGAGKSTLINILAGITNKTSGKCLVNGHDLDLEPLKVKLSLGIVPQEVVSDPFFTVRQTLENYAGYFGVPKNQRRTEEIIEALSLTNKADSPSRGLSGGMKRRLLIAKALVHNPKILILDEPTAGVDIELREQLWDYVKNLNKQGTTVILTTHYIEEAENLCSHIAVINQGQIIAKDKKENLLGILQEKTITITFDRDVSQTMNGSKLEIAESMNLLFTNNLISFRYKDTNLLLDFIKFISSLEITITNIESKGANLEDVLKHLIKSSRK